MSVVQERLKEEAEILKNIKRGILKSAKKGDFHYYWEIAGLSPTTVKGIVAQLETEGKMVSSKGTNFKIIRW